MSTGFYARLALTGMRKNRRLVLPYALTCVLMVAMHYIITALSLDESLSRLPGGGYIGYMLSMGGGIIALFAAIFLFYTHSFLMRRRKKEFGLYNILGMGKGNVARILFWETLFLLLLALAAGLLAGMACSKLAQLGLIDLLQGDVDYELSVSAPALRSTATAFTVIFLLLYLNALRQVEFSSPLALLHSEQYGEKPPRGNWLLGLAGAALLVAAYGIAISITNPLAALAAFFGAVAMVIVGTYLVMIAGSVVFCRILQRRKGYYYKPQHFVSVASMVYRMKRNGAGLASICILMTMVLVMITSTASLYFGGEASLYLRYPYETNFVFRFRSPAGLADENIASLRGALQTTADEQNTAGLTLQAYRMAAVPGILENGEVEVDINSLSGLEELAATANVTNFCFVPLADYNAIMGAKETLAPGEALLYCHRISYTGTAISFKHGQSFTVKGLLTDFPVDSNAVADIVPSIVVVVPDLREAIRGLDTLANFQGDPMLSYSWSGGFDADLDVFGREALHTALQNTARALREQNETIRSTRVETRMLERKDFYAMYGGLFYLGILLSVVFLVATVLIIYYKQISEGYEDQGRFEIMQKVGMTRKAIRRSINSQLLTVFFLPLALAACHLAFAFPIVQKLLLLFNFDNVGLFAAVNAGCLVVFGAFYALVYKLTSNAYYGIVSGAREG